MPLKDGAINEILPFAGEALVETGDIISIEAYAAHPLRKRGHVPGIALRELQNREARQATHMATGLAQFIANRYAPGVLDNGDIDALETGLTAALAASWGWLETINYNAPWPVIYPPTKEGKIYLCLLPSGPDVAGVGAKIPGEVGSANYWLDYADSIEPKVDGSTIINMDGILSANTSLLPVANKIPVAGADGKLAPGWADGFPAGTRLLFQQTAAPTGWVKETGAEYNDCALRFVTGNVGTAGATAFSSAFNAAFGGNVSGSIGATTLTAAQMPNHSHGNAYNNTARSPAMGNGILAPWPPENTYQTLTTGGSQPHTHSLSGATCSLNFNLKRADVIICTKAA